MSTVSITLDPGEVSALANSLERTIDEVRSVAQQSSTATAEWLRDRITDDLAGQTGIAAELFKRRVKKYVSGRVGAGGRVFVGLFRLEASQTHLGQLTQEKDGARGGRHFFPGAFVATMPSGFVGIFKRTGKFGRNGNASLERIDVERVDLPSAQSIIRAHELPAQVYFLREFDRRLKGVIA